MEKYFKRKLELSSTQRKNDDGSKESKQNKVEIDLASLPADPGLRTRILDYSPNVRDQIRRAYLQKGPCQPRNHIFPMKKFGKGSRRFNPAWFDEYSNWLEYSIEKDAAFCLCCYLFKPNIGEQAGGDSFVVEGFSNWKKKEKLQAHVGGPNSTHNQAWRMCEALMNQNQHIQTIFLKQSDQSREEYRARLSASIDCVRFLLQQGLAFRGDDESKNSNNRGNFLELLSFLADHNNDINRVVLKNAPENLKLTSPKIQKDIVNAIAIEVTNVIVKELGDSLFSILIDEAQDLSGKEQMAVVLRYVNKIGQVIERFIGIEHVVDTTALSLKKGIDALLSRHGLSMSKVRGQGYDGASNMRGEFNGLKALVLKENECAFYIHCFAHQLQLALVAVAKNHIQINTLFCLVANVVNVIGASPKRRDLLQEKQVALVIEALNNSELSSGQGLNQSRTLHRPCDTRWNSHYSTLISLINMFSSVVNVLEVIAEDGMNSEQRYEANNLMESIQSYDFVFSLHLMRTILGITNELSEALQRKDQDIVNAMNLVKVCKQQLQMMRESGWDSLLNQVSSFCGENSIDIPDMDAQFQTRGRPRRKAQDVTNLHHYRVELFYAVIDLQFQELNNRFTEVNTELLLCLACLCPDDSFSAFNKERLICLAKFYPKDFSPIQLMVLEDQLETYIIDVRSDSRFSGLKGIGALAQRMVETKKDTVYSLVYSLITLALILPVATATVERGFSAMKIIKSRLRNKMEDQWMNDSLLVYIEKDITASISNDAIMQRFQNMKTRRGQL